MDYETFNHRAGLRFCFGRDACGAGGLFAGSRVRNDAKEQHKRHDRHGQNFYLSNFQAGNGRNAMGHHRIGLEIS
jgi:hypothetical protein